MLAHVLVIGVPLVVAGKANARTRWTSHERVLTAVLGWVGVRDEGGAGRGSGLAFSCLSWVWRITSGFVSSCSHRIDVL